MLQRFSQWVQGLALSVLLVGVVHADEPLLLRHKLEKGSTHILRSKVENKTTQSIAGMNLDSAITQTGIEVRVVEDVDANGNAKIKTKTERLKAGTKIPVLGDYEFDSTKPERDKSSSLGSELTPLYERLVGSDLNFEVTSRGVVTSFTGYSQLVADVIKDKPLASQFAGGGSDNVAKLGAQGAWIVFPENAVKPGDKWENPLEMDLAGLGVIKGKETVTLLAIEVRDGHKIAKLSSFSDLAFDAKLDMGGAKVTGKITSTNSSGSSEFDITAGKLLKQTAELTLSGQLTVEVNNTQLPLQLTQTLSSEQVAIDKLPE